MDTGILFREDITENVIAIKINRSYKENITKDGLYEITRGYWKIDIKKLNMWIMLSVSLTALS